ncbi:class I SAM-dependent methyltransferase [Leucobacter sp.]
MDPELIDRLRADLDTAGYRVEAVAALLGSAAEAARQRGVFAPARRALRERGDAPLAQLIRVLLLGEATPPDEFDAALPALGADGAIRLGLLEPDGAGDLRAALSLNPVEVADSRAERPLHWWILSDLDDQLRRGPARADHVMGVGGATRSLIAQAAPHDAPRCLDLGTGCGVVAMHLALRGRVIATDISERALMMARANARLNGVERRIEFRRGDLFAPVADERFDLILSNPPFVITPRASGAPVYEYRDGGMTGDGLAERVVREAPGLLAEDGELLCLANWESPWGANGLERVRGWIAGAAEAAGALDAWVIERDRVEPAQYAETWARDGGSRPGSAEFEGLMEAWLDDFSARRIVAVGLGSIRVRRAAAGRRGAAAVHIEHAPGGYGAGAPGLRLSAAFDAGVAAELMSDAEVLAVRWLLDDAVSEEREHRPGEEAPRAIVLTTDRPIARRVTADPLLAAALGACDGELALGRIADALATLLEVDAGAAAEALVSGVRELAWFGMLAPAES